MVIELQDICMNYRLKTVLRDVSLTFSGSKVHALLGENGAGKSTLAKIISGSVKPSSGSMKISGREVSFNSEKDALDAGIAIVQQRPLLASSLSVRENILAAGGKKISRNELRAVQEKWAPGLDINSKVRDLGGNRRFYASLIASMCRKPECLILDEPSAFLDSGERDALYSRLREECKNGLTVIVITHSMAEAASHADTVCILREGRVWKDYGSAQDFAGEKDKYGSGISRVQAAEKKNGSGSCIHFIHASSRPKDRSALFDADIEADYGQISAVLGLKEAAIDTLENLVCGMDGDSASGYAEYTEPDGTVHRLPLRGRKYSPAFLRSRGAAVIPSDRTFRASNPGLSVARMLSTYTKKYSRDFCISLIKEAGVNIQPEESCSSLSGGMLQRLILARELSVNPSLVIFCNPLQGLDTEAQSALIKKTLSLADAGKAVLIVGAQDFPLSSCSRVYSLEQGCTHLSFCRRETE